jgi:hypothetical protein
MAAAASSKSNNKAIGVRDDLCESMVLLSLLKNMGKNQTKLAKQNLIDD